MRAIGVATAPAQESTRGFARWHLRHVFVPRWDKPRLHGRFYLRLMAVLNEERWLAHTYRCRSTNSLSGLFVWFGLFLSYHIVITVHLQLADSCEHACACLRACVHRDCMSQPLLCVWITFTLALSQILASACRLVEKWSLIDWCHLDPVPACTRSFQISYFCTLHHSKHTSHSLECHLFVCVRGMAHH